MFFWEKKLESEEPSTISCDRCRCLVHKADTKKVVEEHYRSDSMCPSAPCEIRDRRYCRACAPPYEKMESRDGEARYFRKATIEVSEAGKIKKVAE